MSDAEDEVMNGGGEEEEEEDVDEPMEDGGDEDEDEEEVKSTPTKGKKGAAAASAKGKKGEKAAAAASKGKKASPAKRKEAPSGGESGGAAKKAKPITSESSAKDVIRTYMKQQNRPYTALVLYENLHQTIKKPLVIRICDELVEEGDLQMKDFKKTRLYMAKQSDAAAVSPAELEAIGAKEAQLRDAITEQKAKNAKIDSQIRQLQNEPSDEELAKQLAAYKKQIDILNSKLARFKNDKNPVTKDGMNKTQLKFNEAFKQWRLRKRASEDMISTMCGDEGDPKEMRERFKIDTDEEAGDKMADWKDLVKEIKK